VDERLFDVYGGDESLAHARQLVRFALGAQGFGARLGQLSRFTNLKGASVHSSDSFNDRVRFPDLPSRVLPRTWPTRFEGS
jgi:hypothetical protein